MVAVIFLELIRYSTVGRLRTPHCALANHGFSPGRPSAFKLGLLIWPRGSNSARGTYVLSGRPLRISFAISYIIRLITATPIYEKSGAPGQIRTDTNQLLRLMPLPLGYWSVKQIIDTKMVDSVRNDLTSSFL